MGSSYHKIVELEERTRAEQIIKHKELEISERITALDTQVFFKPSDKALSEVCPVITSKNLTLFTFTIGKDFAETAKESLKKCTGVARLVFSINDTHPSRVSKQKAIELNVNQIFDSLIEIQTQRDGGSSIEIYINQLSHIKLLQRDEHMVYGSVNFSKSSDGPTNDSGYLSYDELICESTHGGQDVADAMISYLKLKYPNLVPIRLDHSTLSKPGLILAAKNQVIQEASSKLVITNVKETKVTVRYANEEDIKGALKDIVSIQGDPFEMDPELKEYINGVDIRLEIFYEELKLSTDIKVQLSLIGDLYDFLEKEVNTFNENNFDLSSRTEEEYDCQKDNLYDVLESGNLFDEIESGFKVELDDLRSDFLFNFESKLNEFFDTQGVYVDEQED